MEHCEEYLELISAAVDGQLSPQARQALNQHLAQCPGCRALYAAMAENRAALNAVGESEPPGGFAQAVMERVQAEPRRGVIPLFRRPQVKKLLATAACALLCVGVVRFAAGSIGMGSAAPTSGNSTGGAPASSYEATASDTARKQESGGSEDGTALYSASAAGGTEKNSSDGAGDAPAGHSALTEAKTGDTQPGENGAGSGDTSSFAGISGVTELPLVSAAQYRVDWSEVLDPEACILRSRDDLDELLARLDTDGLADRFSGYDQSWFDGDNQLVAVVVTESSGSVYHEITGLYQSGDQVQVTVLRRAPEEGTCDMAAWLLTAETCLPEGVTLSVVSGEISG